MIFRPLPGLTIISVLALAILLALGFWQLERLQWKRELIATAERNLAAPATPLGRILPPDYSRVRLTGRFDNAKEIYIFGTDATGAPIYHVVVPFEVSDGRVFLIDRGHVPKERLDPATRREGLRDGPVSVTGVWRHPEGPGSFTPPPDIARRIFYAHDLEGIARLDRVVLAAPVIVEADAAPNPGGWPKGGQTVVAFRNDHLQYAITWFGLAATLIGVYLAYHVSRGRLGFR